MRIRAIQKGICLQQYKITGICFLDFFTVPYYDTKVEVTNLKKLCIFDLDGTLANTLDSLAYSVEETLKAMELPAITREQCREFVGNGAKKLLELALEASREGASKRLPEAMQIYEKIFDENCDYHAEVYEGMMDVVQTLHRQGIRLAVLTNKPDRQAKKVMKKLFPEGLFQKVWGQKETMERKPSPEGISLLLEHFGVEKEACLYIGDSEVDIHTGRNAQVETLTATWGFRSRQELEKCGAITLVDHPKDILQFTGGGMEHVSI
ncbi:HAD-IIIA family hydrolase [Clostridiaceae bacterium 68-1-5]|uniref:HAD-IIIA family hydrolase n=1 Tax=Suipraeoptans intestinalis TaxID=2606628 RepID=A0A6N7V5N8_9FIRM|nr:HAD-IIIA family hydrolase [Suipraeoptans intestinalis]